MKDTHGRTIDYLRISLTDRCNFRCIYCMPEEGVDQLSHKDILRFGEIVEIAHVAAQMGIKRLRLTGGEPWSVSSESSRTFPASRASP